MKREIKRTITVFLVVCFFVSLTATETSAMIIKTGTVDGSSPDSNWAEAKFDIAGFKYPGLAYVYISGWDFSYQAGQKNVKNFGIYQMRVIEGEYGWTNGVYDVRSDGHVRGKFIGMSEAQDGSQNPFSIRINYVAMQDA
jgi:hypothetical protein